MQQPVAWSWKLGSSSRSCFRAVSWDLSANFTPKPAPPAWEDWAAELSAGVHSRCVFMGSLSSGPSCLDSRELVQAVGGVSPHSQAFARGSVLTVPLSERPPAAPSWMHHPSWMHRPSCMQGAAAREDPAVGEVITHQMAQGLCDYENICWGFKREP